ncbi:MAG: flagellin [Planctomycetota bacterium]|nr:flagellin [Planctomycetota bacterium]
MRIGINPSGVDLTAQNNLMRAFEMLTLSNQRLSTMQRINSGSDDPAGLIAVDQIEAELASLEAASRNASRAVGTIHTADSGLAAVSDLLNQIRGNVVAVANSGAISDEEVAANQLEVNAAVDAINLISANTSFGGRNLLDGSADSLTFVFSSDVADTSTLSLPNVHATALGGGAGSLGDLASGGSASMESGQMAKAMEILDNASAQVRGARTTAGAFEKYTIGSSRKLIDASEVNLSQAVSTIRDTNVAEETSNYIRSQILFNSALATLEANNESRGLIGSLLRAV